MQRSSYISIIREPQPRNCLRSELLHCVKRVQIRSFFWSVFSRIWTEYGDLRSKYLYSVQVRENMDQKKLRIWTTFAQC